MNGSCPRFLLTSGKLPLPLHLPLNLNFPLSCEAPRDLAPLAGKKYLRWYISSPQSAKAVATQNLDTYATLCVLVSRVQQ